MLCLDTDKIMPERDFCQAFCAFFCIGLFNRKSMTYDLFPSKCFKNKAKKMALSLNFFATRYSGTDLDQIRP